MADQFYRQDNSSGLSFRIGSRRNSSSSTTSQSQHERRNYTLDRIHTTASQSDTLISFSEFEAPKFSHDHRNHASSHAGGPYSFGGFYNRLLRASVGQSVSPQPPISPRKQPHSPLKRDSDFAKPTTSPQRPTSSHTLPASRQDLTKMNKLNSYPPETPFERGDEADGLPSGESSVQVTASSVDVDRGLLTSQPRTQATEVPRSGFANVLRAPEVLSSFDNDPVTAPEHAIRTTTEVQKLSKEPEPAVQVPRNVKSPQRPPHLRITRPLKDGSFHPTSAMSVPAGLDDGHTSNGYFAKTNQSSGTASPSERSLEGLPSKRAGGMPERNDRRLEPGNHVPAANDLIYQMQHKVLSKDFWMKDENAKVCFNCGESFTTFRRKHHCRLCGQIYCASCTNLISGKPFGKSNKLRVCKTCNNMLNEDDSSDCSEDHEIAPHTPQVRQIRFSDEPNPSSPAPTKHRHRLPASPSCDPASPGPRRARESRPTTSSISIEHPYGLPRPESSRSLKSLALRPRSSSQRSRRPRSHHMRSLSIGPDGAGILRRRSSLEPSVSAKATPDSTVDPELHPFMSDEGSSDEELPSIAGTIGSETAGHPGPGMHGLLGVLRKARPRPSGLSTLDAVPGNDGDDVSMAGFRPRTAGRPMTRSVSAGSLRNIDTARFGRSDNIFKSSDNLYAMLRQGESFDPQAHRPIHDDRRRSPDLPSAELNEAGSKHLRRLLHQCLSDAHVGEAKQWERALVPALLRCAENVDPNVQRGDRIDIRTYVKIKKVPGGAPRDTSLVRGIVFTNNVVLKDMPRSLHRPRVLLISFPLIYARHQHHFMSLEGVVAQEEEYLKNLTARIVKLKPKLLLVQGEVSGIVQKLLMASGTTVVHDVKPSVLQAVSRFTQTKIISSVDRLTMQPDQLGVCGQFHIKTFIVGNLKRSLVYISECPADLGCTIVLRGADTNVLKKVKWITEFLTYVAYNLKLETSLMQDQAASLPAADENNMLRQEESAAPIDADHTQMESYDAVIRYLRQRILSASPLVRLPEPYLLKRGNEQEVKLQRLQRLRQLQDPEASTTDQEERSPVTNFELVRPDMIYKPRLNTPKQVREILRAIHDAEYERTNQSYAASKRRWDAYLADVVEPFSPFTHQKIVVQHSIICNATADACVGPELVGFEYYQEHDVDEGWERDMPLGEYIERLCGQADSPCTAGRCDEKMLDHHRQYVHGQGQVLLHLEKNPPRFKGTENTILMWSICKQCGYETPVVPMSADAWKYSFGKYLELCFWNTPVRPRGEYCPHDILREHDRLFGYRKMSVRVSYNPIDLVEVIVPRSTITWVVEKDVAVKNDIYERVERRITRYMSSVKLRLKSIKVDTMPLEKQEECKDTVEALMRRADEEHGKLTGELQEKYMRSRFYETIPLNGTLRSLQERVAGWDRSFREFEANYFPSSKDLRRLAVVQFRKTFLDKEEISGPAIIDEKSDDQADVAQTLDAINSQKNDEPSVPASIEDTNASARSSTLPKPDRLRSLDLATPEPGLQAKATSHVSDDPAAIPGVTVVSPTTAEKGMQLDAKVAAKADYLANQGARHDANEQPHISSPGRPKHSALTQPSTAPNLLRSQTSPATVQHAKPDLGPTSEPRVNTDVHGSQTAVAEDNGRVDQQPPPNDRIGGLVRLSKLGGRSMIPRAIANHGDNKRVSALAKHFEQMSREFEKEKLRERRLRMARTRQSRAFPTASANPILEVFRDVHEAVRDRMEGPAPPTEDTASSKPEGLIPKDELADVATEAALDKAEECDMDVESEDMTLDADRSEENTLLASYPASEAEGLTSDTEVGTLNEHEEADEGRRRENADYTEEQAKQDTNLLNRILASLWEGRSSSGWTALDYPLTPNDHIFVDSDLIVREDEPSSLIAFALTSRDYIRKMQRFRDRAKAAGQVQEAASPTNAETIEDVEVENVLLGKTATHMRYQFEDAAARLQCKIFYAESFDAIRRKCGVAERFVESLSRGIKADMKGGKSKSLFLQTHDKRFVLKSLTPVEVTAFLKFAPDYFDFMSKCLFHNLPSSLVKMLGLYQIVIKNPATGTDFSQFIQVMENVFYEGEPMRKFDLKGSMRNRKAEETGQPGDVLLDENYLDFISHHPLHVRYHSSAVLNSSITNDTLFCSKQNVMDYSLIIGHYEEQKEVVVGIIDYIRTYTWDKKLETWIKDRGSRKATVRSPKEYRTRFRRSIPTYFPHAPSTWQIFGMQRIDPARIPVDEVEAAGEEDVEVEGEIRSSKHGGEAS